MMSSPSRLRGVMIPGAVVLAAVPTSAFAQTTGNDGGYSFIAIFLLIVALLYEIPAIVAFLRRHPNRWLILVINTAFAGTGIVWLVCLVWAFRAVHITADPQGTNGGESGLNLAANDVRRIRVEHLPPPLPPPVPMSSASGDMIDRLERLKRLLDDRAIDQEQFTRMRQRIIGEHS